MNIADTWGQTPLFFAVSCEWPELCDLLITSGCNLEAVDREGKTVLHRSIRNSTTLIMEKLLK